MSNNSYIENWKGQFKELVNFVRKPSLEVEDNNSLLEQLKGLWRMFIIKMVLTLIIGITIALIYDPENITQSDMRSRFSLPVLFIVSVIILPLLEEIAFRFSLKFRPLYLSMTVCVLSYYLISKGIYEAKLSNIHDHIIERILFSLLLFILTYALVSIKKIKTKLMIFWRNKFPWIVYFFCISFAWVHIFNYEIILINILLMPILTLPKLSNALCYSYVRIKYGILGSYSIHIITNCLGFSVAILSNSN